MIQSEVNALCNELESLRRQKHNLEEERAKNDQQRDKEVWHKILWKYCRITIKSLYKMIKV